jgi:hypothetical protein
MVFINTYVFVENQLRILDNQESKSLPIGDDTNKKVTHIVEILEANLSK